MSNYSDNTSADHQYGVKGAEVFVGGLAQSVTETLIREVFCTCGEIVEVRMIKDLKGNAKGYCFVRFSTKEAAVRAVKDKAGLMLKGRKIGVLPSTEQNSLFLGNLPKEWSRTEFDRVVRQAFQDVDSVNLVMLSSDGVTPTQKQQNRGFGFVQFSTHAAAGRAYRLSSKSEFVLGGKCHPTVKWAEEEPEIDPTELAKVKIAFIRNLPADVTEGFLRKLFGPYGEIEKIVLSKKGHLQVGFVHYAERQGLDNAVKQLHDRTVQGPNSDLFKLQVEVARPFEKNKKRAREGSSRAVTNVNQSKVLKAESSSTSSGGHVLNLLEEHLVADPYEAAVVSLPAAAQDRLLRILRLDIANRYDIDIRCLKSLKEIPESAAISVLDQFLLSGGEEIDKGAFLARLITKYQVRSLGTSQIPEYTSRPNEFISLRSELTRLPCRSQVPVVDYFSSHVSTSRYEKHFPHVYFDSLSPRAGITRKFEERNTSPVPRASITRIFEERNISPVPQAGITRTFEERNTSPLPRADITRTFEERNISAVPRAGITRTFDERNTSQLPRAGITRTFEESNTSPPPQVDIRRTFEERNTSSMYLPGSLPGYGRMGTKSPILAGASHLPTPQVRFDPYTGEPYKFDPYTGEPIQPESLSRGGRSFY